MAEFLSPALTLLFVKELNIEVECVVEDVSPGQGFVREGRVVGSEETSGLGVEVGKLGGGVDFVSGEVLEEAGF